MTILDYIIVAGAALVGIVGVAWALVFLLEDCEHLLKRGKKQGHDKLKK